MKFPRTGGFFFVLIDNMVERLMQNTISTDGQLKEAMKSMRSLFESPGPCRFAPGSSWQSYRIVSIPTIRAAERSLSNLKERPKPPPKSTITGYYSSAILDETIEIFDCALNTYLVQMVVHRTTTPRQREPARRTPTS